LSKLRNGQSRFPAILLQVRKAAAFVCRRTYNSSTPACSRKFIRNSAALHRQLAHQRQSHRQPGLRNLPVFPTRLHRRNYSRPHLPVRNSQLRRAHRREGPCGHRPGAGISRPPHHPRHNRRRDRHSESAARARGRERSLRRRRAPLCQYRRDYLRRKVRKWISFPSAGSGRRHSGRINLQSCCDARPVAHVRPQIRIPIHLHSAVSRRSYSAGDFTEGRGARLHLGRRFRLHSDGRSRSARHNRAAEFLYRPDWSRSVFR